MTQLVGQATSTISFSYNTMCRFEMASFCICDTGHQSNIWRAQEDVCDSCQTFVAKFAVIIGVFSQIITRKLICDSGQIFQIRCSVNPLIYMGYDSKCQ